MGLLKAGAGAVGGVLADQWREFFYCDALDANTLAVGNVRLNLSACALEGPEGRERLSNREFQILEMLMRHPGGRFPTERLLLDVWGDEAPEGPGVVWVYISCLRKKLAAVGADVRLSAARNQGYALEEGLGERA